MQYIQNDFFIILISALWNRLSKCPTMASISIVNGPWAKTHLILYWLILANSYIYPIIKLYRFYSINVFILVPDSHSHHFSSGIYKINTWTNKQKCHWFYMQSSELLRVLSYSFSQIFTDYSLEMFCKQIYCAI